MFDPDELDAVAASYHEAGHVAMAMWLGGVVTSASIECDDEDDDGVTFAGRTTVQWRDVPRRERLRRSAMVALAGPIAEQRWRGETPVLEAVQAWHHDWLEVEAALRHEGDAVARDAALRGWLHDVWRALTDEAAWAHLCCIADAREAHGTLDDSLLDQFVVDGVSLDDLLDR